MRHTEKEEEDHLNPILRERKGEEGMVVNVLIDPCIETTLKPMSLDMRDLETHAIWKEPSNKPF